MEDVASDQVGICLDVANSFGTGEGLETVMRRLRPWVFNLHVKDVCIRRIDTLMGFLIEGCPAGQGRIDIPWGARTGNNSLRVDDLGKLDPQAKDSRRNSGRRNWIG